MRRIYKDNILKRSLTNISFFPAFGSIMFAFAGASTFPTIQADMKERSKFPISATIAIGSKWDTSL